MKRITMIVGIALSLAIPQMHLVARGACDLAPGESEIIYTVEDVSPYVASTEGIAADFVGNLYVSHRIGGPGAWAVNEVIRISPWGSSRVIAEFGPAAPGTFGLVGLTCDWWGNVYVAFPSGNENHGVWKIRCDGRKERLRGSENIVTPNALTFDWRGNLYVSDSYPADPEGPGLIWRYSRRTRHFEVWASSHDLAPDPIEDPLSPPPPDNFPGPGANGVAFAPPNHLYVANSEKSLIVHIPILRNGRAGEVEVIASMDPLGLLFGPDGISIDMDGNLYAAITMAGIVPYPMSPVVRIYPDTGEVEPVVPTVVGGFPPNFEIATSLVFGGWYSGRKSLYVANSGLAAFGLQGPMGAGVTKVGVGVKGIPLQ